jgi:hypothetical protein
MQDQENQPQDVAHEIAGHAEELAPATPEPALALDEDERLPWLESADEDEEEGQIDTARLVRFALFGLALLALIGGSLWFIGHRGQTGSAVAEGGTIKAPEQPYKEVPRDQGGKTYAGTGDSAFAVSEGKNPTAKLGDGVAPGSSNAASGAAHSTATPSIAAGANAPAGEEGVGVQIGAYTSQNAAEAGWTRLSANAALKGVKHRIVEGSADIGTVYRLQAVTADVGAANSLCSALKAAGLACQVKH